MDREFKAPGKQTMTLSLNADRELPTRRLQITLGIARILPTFGIDSILDRYTRATSPF